MFRNVFQYQTAKFNNAKPQLLLHQSNRTIEQRTSRFSIMSQIVIMLVFVDSLAVVQLCCCTVKASKTKPNKWAWLYVVQWNFINKNRQQTRFGWGAVIQWPLPWNLSITRKLKHFTLSYHIHVFFLFILHAYCHTFPISPIFYES